MKVLILIMTIFCGALWLISACLTIWYAMQGAVWPWFLQFVGTGLTFAGMQVGVWWLRHNK